MINSVSCYLLLLDLFSITLPVTNTVTKPTTVLPPITIAVFSDPRKIATMHVAKADNPISNPNICPLLTSAADSASTLDSIPL